MASFTSEIKRELLSSFPRKRDNAVAEIAAFLNTACSVAPHGEVVFVSENERIAEYFLRLTDALNVKMELGDAVCDPKRKRDKLTFYCAGEDASKLLSAAFPKSAMTHFAEDRGRAVSYLRAAFLGGGSCTLPQGEAKTGYHLEFVFSTAQSAESFSDLLTSLDLLSKLVVRGEKHVVYCKSREIISDFLSTVDAKGALRRLEAVSSEREESNHFNRVSNCYAGNADKSAIASASQIVALRRMQADGLFATLPDALIETARERMQNPADSLSELAGKLGVSKSCLNHRLRKLMALYDKSYNS